MYVVGLNQGYRIAFNLSDFKNWPLTERFFFNLTSITCIAHNE